MSLKGFHIVFVTVSLLLFGFLIAWGFALAEERDGLTAGMGWTGVAGCLLMTVYGIYFMRKARRIEL